MIESEPSSLPPRRLLLVARDRLFRESLAMELAFGGWWIADFDALEAALAHLSGGASADGLIVEAELADAAEPPAGTRTRGDLPPLVLLAPAGGGWASAGRWDAVGVVDRERPLAVVRADLLRRFGVRGPRARGAEAEAAAGGLEFREDGRLAFWRRRRLDLTEPELALLTGLVEAPGLDLTYRRAAALLQAAETEDAKLDPAAFRGRVQRIIERFREVDPGFERIVFLPGRGYRWEDPAPPSASGSAPGSVPAPTLSPTARSSLG